MRLLNAKTWGGRLGFTLIELLVVIAVIALLAGLVAGLLPKATQDKKEKLIRTQLATLVTVLESYKKKHGFYPPGNPGNPARPTLFYEVTGTLVDPSGMNFTSIDGVDTFSVNELRAYGVDGLINTGPNARAVKNFYPGVMPSQVQVDADPPSGVSRPLRFLVVQAAGADGEEFNPWRYNSISPTNNPQSFDLWAEFAVGSKVMTIGNWAQ